MSVSWRLWLSWLLPTVVQLLPLLASTTAASSSSFVSGAVVAGAAFCTFDGRTRARRIVMTGGGSCCNSHPNRTRTRKETLLAAVPPPNDGRRRNRGTDVDIDQKNPIQKQTTSITATQLRAKNNKKNPVDDDRQREGTAENNQIRFSPATVVLLPLVVVFGLDLLLNVFFLTKRTLEFVVWGKLPSTETWFSDQFFWF